MSESIINVIKNSVLGKRFHSIGYLPRWIIFAIDVFIVFVASVITYFIIYSLTGLNYNYFGMVSRYGLIILINAVFFLIYRTYSGIIRLSTFIDGVKLLVSTTTSYIFLLIINFSCKHTGRCVEYFGSSLVGNNLYINWGNGNFFGCHFSRSLDFI